MIKNKYKLIQIIQNKIQIKLKINNKQSLKNNKNE